MTQSTLGLGSRVKYHTYTHTYIYICTVCKELRETPVGSWYLMKYILCAKIDKYVLRVILITS